MSRAPSRIEWGLLPLVMAGGALGVLARHLLTLATPGNDVVALIAINLAGSLLLGVVVGLVGSAPRLRAFLGTGALGGFTSYSALAPMLGSMLALSLGSVGAMVSTVGFALLTGLISVALALAGLSLGGAIAKRGEK